MHIHGSRRRVWGTTIVLLVFSLGLSACGTAKPASPPASPPAQQAPKQALPAPSAPSTSSAPAASQPAPAAPAKLSIRLTWKFKGEFTPLYVAIDKGFFREQNLDVTVEEGSGAGPALQRIAQGLDPVGYIGAVETAQGISKGMPVKMVGLFMRKNPVALAAHPDVQFKAPKDLEGKTLGLTTFDTFERILPAFAKTHGIDLNRVRKVSMDAAARNAAFLQRQVDVATVYVTNDLPILEGQSGKKLNVLGIAEWGYDLMGHGIVVSADYLRTNAAVVKRLLVGVAKGFAYTRDHPDEATEIAFKRFPDYLSKALLKEQIVRTIALMDSESTRDKPLGWQAEKDWQRMLDILAEFGGLEKKLPLDAYFTNELVPDVK